MWACGRGQTHRQTDTQTRVTTIHFSWSSTHAKCNKWVCNLPVRFTVYTCLTENSLQSWRASLQGKTLATTALSARTAVRLSTGRHLLFCSQNQQSLTFCITRLFYSCPVDVEFSWTWPSICCINDLLQIQLKDHTVLCRVQYIARFTAKQRLRFARDIRRYINLHCTVYMYCIVTLRWRCTLVAYRNERKRRVRKNDLTKP